MHKPYSGIIPPLVTPLKSRDEIDYFGLERLVNHVLAGGVHGIFVLGTTGEAPSLSYRLRRELISLVTKQVAGRVPVLVGVTDTSYVETVELSRHAHDAGADAVVLSTPYYFPAGQTELLGYMEHLIADLPLPLVIYNMPSLTKVWFEIDTILKLAHHPRIIGIKDSSGDLEYFEQVAALKKTRPDWFVMMGPEAMLIPALEKGGDGGVNGGANVMPRLFVECYQAYRSGNSNRAAELNALIQKWQSVYDIGKYASRHIKATKCSLSILGICDDFMAEPFNRFHPPERMRVDSILKSVLDELHGFLP
ncbi:MAG: dihydrodipicolinate synthase family protein [Pirellula sp.]|jgi:4-hydroxy-tetrahydrodipicolinate synthase|nr:dihydrodipicolinate synthase family protein [Pirellula sp.]